MLLEIITSIKTANFLVLLSSRCSSNKLIAYSSNNFLPLYLSLIYYLDILINSLGLKPYLKQASIDFGDVKIGSVNDYWLKLRRLIKFYEDICYDMN